MKIHYIQKLLSLSETLDILCHELYSPPVGPITESSKMGGEEHILKIPQWTLFRQRLFMEYIKTCSTDSAFF